MRLTFEIFSAPKKRIDRRGSLFTISADNSLNNRKIQRLNCGEDSFLRVKSKNIYAFGVFDGVGGCNEHGIDPTFMAWGIADGCKNFFRKNPESSPKSIMKRAYKLVKKTQRIWCATTACLLLFDGETNRLSSGIVGDSSYMIIHKGFQKYTMGCEKRLSFNYPRQYHINKEVKNTREIPSVKDFTLENGDIVIVGTDGLFDNLFPEFILLLVQKFLKEDGDLKRFTRVLVKSALHLSLGKNKTPFSDKGGKYDDITVVVARVEE